ncbi:LPS export ABC transporter permease LptF [Acidisphaera rubrifaciens]|uniref:Transporter YjgP/YjgQ n=1 Tax=Acidisphaera rubrifaciens HS-AP3 TaxID=1231350 RepID=A0A0D6P3G9_9PROT|nr:LPS export ABC transporter permease LptF [Acidisphaera rubrifaciens]GAN75886.1 transporter YjgP/YjgQ [Acidisphaera rubrifaciens HS-AP3]
MPGRPLFTRIDRYMFRQMALSLVAVTGGLAALIWLTQSLRFVEMVVNHGLSLGTFLELTGLLIPSFIAVILPITCFVVVQFIYQRLSGDRELTVMRAAGLSPFALSRPALATGLIAVGVCFLLNLVIVPDTLRSFREFQWEIRNRMAAFLLQDGVFTQISDNMTVYVRTRDADGTLHGIMIDDGRNPAAHATILAQSGRLLETPAGPRVLLQDGSRQEIDRQTGRLNVLTFGENTIDLNRGDKGDANRLRDMSEVSLHDLLHPEGIALPRDEGKWRAEAYKRLTTPLTALSFTMVALYSTLTGMFRRHGGLLRPLVAVLAVVLLLAVGLAVDNLAARDGALIPLMWLHSAGPGILCAWLLFAPELLVAMRARNLRRAAA